MPPPETQKMRTPTRERRTREGGRERGGASNVACCNFRDGANQSEGGREGGTAITATRLAAATDTDSSRDGGTKVGET